MSRLEDTPWQHHRVQLGAVHTYFVLVLGAYVPNNESIVAIDNIHLESCSLDEAEGMCRQDEFQCPHTSQCVPRQRVCDLHSDCYCAEDESPSQCEDLPREARAEFQNCDLNNGQCFWYNVPSPRGDTLPWSLFSPAHAANRSSDHPPLGNFSGSCAYVTALSSQPQWTSHLLRSVDFPSLPEADSSCAVRFQFWVSGHSKLTVQVQELGGQEARTLWQSPDAPAQPRWTRVIVPVNTVPVLKRYVLQLLALVEKGYRKSTAAVANITLSPECFAGHNEVELSPCGAKGEVGPTPEQCAQHYGAFPNATVLSQPPLTGAQLWTTPLTAQYSLQAYGARGGWGREETDSELSYGAHVQAKFQLTQGDTLAVIVGQRGHDSPQMNKSVENSPESFTTPSGGGGGGATFVYKFVKEQEPQLLMMAGGGGGLDYVSFADNSSVVSPPWPGSWEEADNLTWSRPGEVGTFSGRGCPWADTASLAPGGYGAGHGACNKSGGHGGGSNVDSEDGQSSLQYVGWPGSVYVHQDNLLASFLYRSHPGDGSFKVRPVNWRCPCHYLCLWARPDLLQGGTVPGALGHSYSRLGPEGQEVFRCICPPGTVLAADEVSCLVPEPTVDGPDPIIGEPVQAERRGAGQTMAVETAVSVSVAVVVALIALVIFFFVYVMRSSPQDRLWSLRQVLTRCLRNRSQSLPLHTLPASALPARVLHINPNYSMIASKVSDTKLPEIPRDNLRMSMQLGSGAFGEVYKGFLSGMSGTEREVAVAVKTLPPLCSEQTELDFFMEAYIISKFNHPNIVHFLGVCFEQHPRYIVLEVLEGGNLKSFLRENRPSEGQMSKLCVGDLICLARDICCGCCYLEERHFIHRDIAARNCLLTTKKPERVAKIADFGMSRDVYRADYYKKEGRALLPLKWMPPEAFLEGMFTTKTDVWSYGVVLWEIFAMGYMPYPALSNTEVMNFIYIGGRLNCPDGCPSAVYDLMLSCWKHKSEERPSFRSIKLTVDSIAQDTATMSQHMPAFRMPHMANGYSGPRNLMLLNHPVPALGLHLQEPSLGALGSEPPCTEPLLKTAAFKHTLGGSASRGDFFPAKKGGTTPIFVESDSSSSKGSCSSLEPLLPPDSLSLSDSEGVRGVGYPDNLSPEVLETDALMEKERGAGQRVKLPPAGVRCDRLKSLSSLSTLDEQDEVLCEEDKNATV
ncbi:hypothetical protein ACOMHN_040442 [Nucella lapillus]